MGTHNKGGGVVLTSEDFADLGAPGIDNIQDAANKNTNGETSNPSSSLLTADDFKISKSEISPMDAGVGPQGNLSGVDLTKYSEYLGATYYNNAIDKSRAYSQSTSEQLLNGLGNIFVGGTLDIVGNFANITDYLGYAGKGKDRVGTDFSRQIKKSSEYVSEELFPIFQKNPGESWDVSDSAWWIKHGSNTLKSAYSFLATGALTGGALNSLGVLAKIAGASKKALGWIKKGNALVNATMLNQAESMLDAITVYDSIYNEYIELGLSEEESKIKASSAASTVINANRVNIALNLSSAGMFLKSPQLSRQVFKKAYGKVILGESAQEYMEEIVNDASQNLGTKKVFGIDSGFGGELVNSFFSKQGTEAGFWGAIGGAVQTGGSLIMDVDNSRAKHKEQQSWIQQFDKDRSDSGLNSMYSAGVKSERFIAIKNKMTEAYENIQKSIDTGETINPKDVSNYEFNKSLLLSNQAWDAFEKGAGENVETFYKEVKSDAEKAIQDIKNKQSNSESDESAPQQEDGQAEAQEKTQEEQAAEEAEIEEGTINVDDKIKSLEEEIEQADFALDKLKMYEKEYNELGGLDVDRDKAFSNKVAIDFIKDRTIQLEKYKLEMINKINETLTIWNASNSDPSSVVYSDGMDLNTIEDFDLMSMIESSPYHQSVININKAIEKSNESMLKFQNEYDKILTSKYQLRKASENKSKNNSLKSATKAFNNSITNEKSTAIDIKNALKELEEAYKKGYMTEDDYNSFKALADAKIADKDKTSEERSRRGEGEPLDGKVDDESNVDNESEPVDDTTDLIEYTPEEIAYKKDFFSRMKDAIKSGSKTVLEQLFQELATVVSGNKNLFSDEEKDEIFELSKEFEEFNEEESASANVSDADTKEDLLEEFSDFLLNDEFPVWTYEQVIDKFNSIVNNPDLGSEITEKEVKKMTRMINAYFKKHSITAEEEVDEQDTTEVENIFGDDSIIMQEGEPEPASPDKDKSKGKKSVKSSAKKASSEVQNIINDNIDNLTEEEKIEVDEAIFTKGGKLRTDSSINRNINKIANSGKDQTIIDRIISAISSIVSSIKVLVVGILMLAGLSGGAFASDLSNVSASNVNIDNVEIVDNKLSSFNIDSSIEGNPVISGIEIIPARDVDGTTPDSSISYRGQWNNDSGQEYIVEANSNGTTGEVLEANDSEFGTDYNSSETSITSSPVFEANYGDHPDNLFPVFELVSSNEAGDKVILSYQTGRELSSDQNKGRYFIPTPSIQFLASEIDGNLIFNESESRSGSDTNTIQFIFQDSSGRMIVRDFAGSIKQVKEEAENISEGFNIPLESIIISRFDANSFASSEDTKDAEWAKSVTVVDGENIMDPSRQDDGIPVQESAANVLVLLMAAAASRNKKAFAELVGKYIRNKDGSKLSNLQIQDRYDKTIASLSKGNSKSSKPKIANITVETALSMKKDYSNKKKDLIDNLDSFSARAEAFNKVSEMILEKDKYDEAKREYIGVPIPLGAAKDSKGKILGQLFLNVIDDKANIYLYISEESGGFSKNSILIESFPYEEIRNRLKEGLMLSKEGKNLVKFNADHVTLANERKKAAEEDASIITITTPEQVRENEVSEKEANKRKKKSVAVDSRDEVSEPLETDSKDVIDNKLANREMTKRFPRNASGNLMGRKNERTDSFDLLYDEFGNTVDAMFVEGAGKGAKVFDVLYSPDPLQKDGNAMFFLGKKNYDNYNKEGIRSGVFYRKKIDTSKYKVKSAFEIFALNEGGQLLINTPEIQIDDEVVLYMDPTYNYITPVDEDNIPILIALEKDFDHSKGKLKEGKRPIDLLVIQETANKYGKGKFDDAELFEHTHVRLIRDHFNKRSNPLGMKIQYRSGGFTTKDRSNSTGLGLNSLSSFNGGYVGDGKGGLVYKSQEKSKRKEPLIFIVDERGKPNLRSSEDYLEQWELDIVNSNKSSINLASSDNHTIGAALLGILNASGGMMIHRAETRHLNESEREYVVNNLSRLLTEEMDRRKAGLNASMAPSNIPGLSDVISMNYISNERRKNALSLGIPFSKLFVKGSINFTDHHIVLEADNDGYAELAFRARKINSKNQPELAANIKPAIDYILGKPEIIRKMWADKLTGSSTKAIYDPITNEMPYYLAIRYDGVFTDYYFRDEAKEKKTQAVGAELAKLLNTNIHNQINVMRRNAVIKIGEKVYLNNNKDKYVDPVTGIEYKSYMSFVDESGVLRHSLDGVNTINNANIWLDYRETGSKDDYTIMQDVIKENKANQATFSMDPSVLNDNEADSPIESVEKKGELSDPVNIDDGSSSIVKPINIDQLLDEFDNKEEILNDIEDSGLDINDEDDAEAIKAIIDSNRRNRVVDQDAGFETMNKEEISFFEELTGDKGKILQADHIISHGQRAWGMYMDGIATVASGAKEGTAYHEAFHLIFDLGLTPRQRASVNKAAKKRYAGREQRFKDIGIGLEEFMADEFMEYMLSDEGKRAMNPNWLRKIFDNILFWIQSVLPVRVSIDSLFRQIAQGKYKSKINSANSMKRNKPMFHRQILDSSIQRDAIDYLKRVVGSTINGVQQTLDKDLLERKKGDKNFLSTDFFSWIKRGKDGGNGKILFDMIAKFDENVLDKNGRPTLVEGKLFNDIARIKDANKFTKTDEFKKLSPQRQKELKEDKVKNSPMVGLINKIASNWHTVYSNDNLMNETSGFQAIILDVFNEAGINIYDGANKFGNESKDDSRDEDNELNEIIKEQSSEVSKDHIHDLAVYFMNSKETIDNRLKAWMFFTPIYEFDSSNNPKTYEKEILVRKKDENGEDMFDDNGNPILEPGETKIMNVIKVHPTTRMPKIIDFHKVYKKLSNLLVNKDFPDMIKAIESIAREDEEVASVWEKVKAMKNHSSNVYSTFFTHFNMDRRNMIVLSSEGSADGTTFKIISSNRQSIENELMKNWRINSNFYANNEEGAQIIDINAIKPISEAMSRLSKWYSQQRSPEAAKFLETRKGKMEFVEGFRNLSSKVLLPMGIDIGSSTIQTLFDMNTLDDAFAAIDNLFFIRTTTGAKETKKAIEQTIFGLVNKLSKGVNIYSGSDEQSTIKRIAAFVKNNNLGMGSDSYMSVNGKMIFGINLNNYLTKKYNIFKSDSWKKEVDKFEQDEFYRGNLFLDMVKDESFREKLQLQTLDGIKNSYTKIGKDYEKSSISESIQARLAMFFNHKNSAFASINTGTKADKGQSIYSVIKKLNKIEKDKDTIDMARDILRRTVDQEIGRILKLSTKINDKDWVQKYGIENELEWDDKLGLAYGNGLKFNYVPGLNGIEGIIMEPESALGMSSNEISDRQEIIDDQIDILLENVIKHGMDEAVKNNVIEKNATSGAYSSNRNTPTSISNVESNLSDFFLNEFIWNLELSKVFMGDLSRYKYSKNDPNAIIVNYFKRAYQLITPGKNIFLEEGDQSNESVQAIIMNDIIKINDRETLIGYAKAADSKISEKKIDALIAKKSKLSPKERLKVPPRASLKERAVIVAIDKYYYVNKTDGFSVVNAEGFRKFMEMGQRWDDSYQIMYDKYWKDDAEIFDIMKAEGRTTLTDEERKQINDGPRIEPFKPLIYGERFSEEHQAILHEQYKNSVFVVTRLMANDFVDSEDGGMNYKDLYRTLSGEDGRVKWAGRNNRFVMFGSAVKVGAYGAVDHDVKVVKEPRDGENEVNEIVVRDILLRNVKFPQVINVHDESIINNGTQQSKIIMGNLLNTDLGFNMPGISSTGGLSGLDIKSMFNGAWSEKISKSLKKLSLDLGLDEDFRIPTDNESLLFHMRKLRDVIRNYNIDRDLTDNYNEAIDLYRDIDNSIRFTMPLDFPSLGKRYENIVMSLFRKSVLSQKVPGISLAQISDFGTQTSDELKFLRRENGEIMAAEIAIPAKIIRHIIGKDAKTGLISDLNLTEDQKHALKVIGYRIPTQSKSSMLPMVITRILPDSYGSTIMVPGEIANQQGSDYDIDKMFLMFQNYDNKNSKVIEYENPMVDGKYVEGKNRKKALENMIFDTSWAVLTNDKYIREVFSPLDSDEFSEIKKEYDKIHNTPAKYSTDKKALRNVYNTSEFNHISAFHTNMEVEYLNKFAKMAVGIISNASTGQTFYQSMNVGINVSTVKKGNNAGRKNYRNFVHISTGEKDESRGIFVESDDSGELISDTIKSYGSAALDNANDPLLGYLDINAMTLNSSLLLSNLGFSKRIVFDLNKQPIIRALSLIFNNLHKNDIDFAINTYNKNYATAAFRTEYAKQMKLRKDKLTPVKLSASKLKDMVGEPLNTSSDDVLVKEQVKVMIAFRGMYKYGRKLSVLNKMLSPERQSKLNGYAQLNHFTSLYKSANGISRDNFKGEDNMLSPDVGRVASFYNVLKKASDFGSQVFASHSRPYRRARGLMASLTSMSTSNPGDSNLMTSFINYSMFTKYFDGFSTVTGGTGNINTMFFSKDGNTLAEEFARIRRDPRLVDEEIMQSLSVDDNIDSKSNKRLYFNNGASRTTSENNSLQSSWKRMLGYKGHPDYHHYYTFAKNLVSYSIVSSGLDRNFNTPHEHIPTSFWIDHSMDYLSYWNNMVKGVVNDGDYISNDDILNMSIQFVRSVPKASPTVSININAKNSGKTSKYIVGHSKEPTLRLKVPGRSNPNLMTYDMIKLNKDAKNILTNSNQFVPFFKYYKSHYVNESKDKYRSGYRLMALVATEGDKTVGVYKEIQWLGSLNFNETNLNSLDPRSIHPINQGTNPTPSEGFYFEHSADEEYNKKNKIKLDDNGTKGEIEQNLEESNPDLEEDEANIEGVDGISDTEVEDINHEEGNDLSKKLPMAALIGTELSEGPSKEVTNSLNSFLSKIGVSTAVTKYMEERFGAGVISVADISNRSIEAANEEDLWRNLPEETAHFYVEGLKNHEEISELVRRAKEDPLYEQVKKEYGEKYNYDEERLARETAAKLIAKHLIAGEAIEKNWMRRLLNKVKALINKIFGNVDPFEYAAQRILRGDDSNLMYSEYGSEKNSRLNDAEPMFKFNATEKLNNIFKLGVFEQADATLEDPDLDFKASLMTKKQVDRLNVIQNDISIGIKKKANSLSKMSSSKSRQFSEGLAELNELIEKDSGIKFVKRYTSFARSQVNVTSKNLNDMMSKSRDGIDTEDKISRLKTLEYSFLYRLGTYDYMSQLTALVQDIYFDQDLATKSSLLSFMMFVEGEIMAVKNRIDNYRKEILVDEINKYSVGHENQELAFNDLLSTTNNINVFDQFITSLSDTDDSFVGKMSRIVRIHLKKAETNFLNFFRGVDGKKGAAQATADYISAVGTRDNETLYKPFIKVEKIESKDKEKTYERHVFINEDELHKLSPVQRDFYDAVILPYINLRKKISENGFAGAVGNPYNAPIIKKRSFESGLKVDTGAIMLTGIKDKFKYVEGEDDLKMTNEKGEIIRTIPVKYGVIKPLNEVSMDIAQTVSLAMENLTHVEEMASIEPLIKTIVKTLETRKLVREIKDEDGNISYETIEANAKNTYDKVKSLIDAIFYADQESVDLKVGGVDMLKASNATRKVITFSNLAFNYFAMIMNPIVMGFFSLGRAIGGRDYKMKDWFKSSALSFKNLIGMTADYNSKNPSNKDTLIMERVGVFSHGLEDNQMSSRGTLFKNFFTKLGYMGFKLGNAMVQPISARAFMLNKKIMLKSGEEISMYDAFEMENGVLSVRKDVIDSIGENEFASMQVEVEEMVRGISDNQGLSDMSVLQQKWWGKFLLMHRSWMVPMFHSLWGSVRPDNISGKLKGGTFRTTLAILGQAISKRNVGHLKTMWGSANNSRVGDIDPFTGKEFTKDSLELYRSNLKQMIFHIAAVTSLTLLNALRGDDDEPEGKLEEIMLYIRLRLNAELLSMVWIGDTYRVFKHPTAAISYIDKIASLIEYSTVKMSKGSEDVRSGKYKGQSKRMAALKKLIPLTSQVDKFTDIPSLISYYE